MAWQWCSLLAAAITWNLGTWYFGIPASSSHTLIGSILGVGLANALINDIPLADGVNWQKAIDIGASLVFSPMAGFLIAALILIGLKWWRPLSKMHKTPEQRRKIDDKKHPPFWNRLVLVISAMAVSFVHGSNDGQKGIGLIMLVLIGIVPAQFVLDLSSTTYQIERTRDATLHLSQFYQRNAETLGEFLALGKSVKAICRRNSAATRSRPNRPSTPCSIPERCSGLPLAVLGKPHRSASLPAVPGRHREESRQAARPGSA
jgi:low-affinity inorganic phosphate transporter